ncbi:hypothetical protein N836_11470 [Leptolyngbya sp. Heron Island J]|uniref:hypothetical protein n=1 Tax=Leptolyngbya sp. Heron Island J TaxID=1385935 RepID=UPI0003B9CBD5|nr:hypothetical protein [Leptolyngbya sp. Heron Island J]ESA35611.1 hypothetical protein N836_11470 [Leptolyngbya sp. Heron Island J]
MRYWEFLIQQEGDQTWLPLETRQVEILEGRYRMAAHTSYDSMAVEIRVSQLLLDEIPPRRRVRKRKTNTNDSGLLAIFPFIQLSPGRWEIDCNSPDVIEDFLGEGGWHYSVQLQVTPRDDDDWDPDWSEAPAEHQPPPSDAQSSSPQPIPFKRPDLGADNAAQVAEFQLQLKQQAYVTQVGQSLTLAGQLLQTAGEPLSHGQLWVQLRDPQTASMLQEIAFDVPNQALPAPFSVTITLPDKLSTQVILGALSLVEQKGPQAKTVLASASFTVTLGLAQMLDAIANQPNLEFEEEISIFPGSTEAFIPPPEKSEALLTGDTAIIPKEIVPSEGLTLPPQIKPSSDLAPDHQPELPTFSAEAASSFRANEASTSAAPLPNEPPEPSTEEVATEEAAANQLLDDFNRETDEVDAFELEQPDVQPEMLPANAPTTDKPTPFAEPNVFDLGSRIEDDDLDRDVATAALDEEVVPQSPAPAAKRPIGNFSSASSRSIEPQWDPAAAAIDRAFEKLQLQERFWQKLNMFTLDGYRQALEVKRALNISEALPEEGSQQSKEFVVPEPPKPNRWEQHRKKQEAGDPIQVMPPMLDVPEQELVAGEWIAIKVRVPTGDYQPYVKVWMNDLQTRTVIDAPRLLMQFIPNDNNELETMIRVQVPNGCLELQFAAISVDMATLQESRKVIQNRRVLPPDDTLSIFDSWDI